MKTTLNKILYKLIESELANPDLSVVNEQAWEKLKNVFKRNKYDYVPVTTMAGNVSSANSDDVVIAQYHLDPPVEHAVINSKWGKWRDGKRHLGIDMAIPAGTPLYAVRPGTVVYIGDNPSGWGNYVITKHEPLETSDGSIGETFFALYAHLSQVDVSVGDEIDFGTVIGKSGGVDGAPGAGNSTGPHLHFEIKTSMVGGSIDPVRFYAKYNKKLENASTITRTRNDNASLETDYIVPPTEAASSNVAPIETPITSDVKNDIISGKTEQDGFVLYKLPNDKTYIYAIPIESELPNKTYDWWTTSKTLNNWVSLKSRLSPNKYKTALSILNTAFPGALNINKLSNTDVTASTTQTSFIGDDSVPEDTTSIFDKLKKNHIYTAPSILKSNQLTKYIFSNKKFKSDDTLIFDDTDNIKYLGHDTSGQYMYVRIMSKSNDPSANKKCWINIKDISISSKKKF